MSKALKELERIIRMEGIDRKSGTEAREIAMKQWISDHIVTVSTSQAVIKTNLSSEEDDFLKYYMAYQMGDKLMDDCITVTNEKNKITTEILALRR